MHRVYVGGTGLYRPTYSLHVVLQDVCMLLTCWHVASMHPSTCSCGSSTHAPIHLCIGCTGLYRAYVRMHALLHVSTHVASCDAYIHAQDARVGAQCVHTTYQLYRLCTGYRDVCIQAPTACVLLPVASARI